MQILTELSGQSRFKGGGEAREIWRKNEGFMGRTAGEGLRKDLIKTIAFMYQISYNNKKVK